MVVADPSTLKGIPELFETDSGESLIARTESLATFRELGPPDLCRIEKHNPKSTTLKDISSYHFALGVDCSSSASLAAYLNSLSYTLVSPTPKTPNPWKIKSGTYCCFNAFSRVDVRVEVRIPGGVESYVVDLRGDKHKINNPEIWQETYVSAMLRAILDDNDEPDGNDGNPILGLRKMDPLDTLNSEKKFLEAAASEFWKGWQLGTVPEVQIATFFSNHLTNGIMKYFRDAGRLDQAAAFFEPLFTKDPEVGAVLAASYFGNDNEVKGVKVLYESLKKNPSSYGLLIAQVDFLINKKKLDTAVTLAKLAVVAAPSEYVTWAKLTQVYIALRDFESALLALNSCPMFSYCERDSQRMPPPARTHLPLRPDPRPDELATALPTSGGSSGGIGSLANSADELSDPRENQVHPELARLPALSLRGTFSSAYALLIQIVGETGWDELLKFRSRVFVMEEEYRIHRAITEEARKEEIENDLEEVEERSGGGNNNKTDNVEKTKVEINGGSLEEDEEEDEENKLGEGPTKNGAPDLEKEKLEELENFESIRLTPQPGDENDDGGGGGEKLTPGAGEKKGLSIDEMMRRASNDVEGDEDEESVQTGVDKMGAVEGVRKLTATPNPRPKRTPINFTFRNKRLCEKWLDNLFMVLYNDLRLYTALKQEMTQYLPGSKTPLALRKTGAEWEVYGDLAGRLLHPEDAKTAYRFCLEQKFSIKSWLKILAMEAEEGNTREALIAVNKVVYPSPIAQAIFKLIGRHGYQKVHNVLIALNVPARNFKLIMRYYEYAQMVGFVVTAGAAATINDVDYAMGMVTLATLVFMVYTDSYDVGRIRTRTQRRRGVDVLLLMRRPAVWVRAMVYLDGLAFFVFYLADAVRSASPCAFFLGLRLAAQTLWALKDAFKFGFVVFRALAIVANKRRWPVYAAWAVSLLLYALYNYAHFAYLFANSANPALACDPDTREPAFVPLIALYLFWAAVEISMSALIVVKMSLSLARVRRANFAVEIYKKYKSKEEMRLLIACLGMLAVTGLTITRAIQGPTASGIPRKSPFAINKLVFVTMQLLLVLNSASGKANYASSNDASNAQI
ncbi:hypothetical protein HK100_011394 [Physocladia obscura]|uniref:Uncharacterized protein n=1 Tax=Physocladia obscura TaxID=109957 RepID=A0AAD5TAR5_9FUNG|nr:hypothetical protein HK100_011394 [Physocladia obscura]